MEEIVKKIYDDTINEVLYGIDDKYKDEVSKSYYKYTLRKCEYIGIPLLEMAYDKMVEKEKERWKNTPVGFKLNQFVKDDALDKIIDISLKGNGYAKERLNNNSLIDLSFAQNMIDELVKLKPQVLEFNRALAETYISDASVDYIYATGLSDNTSLRMGRVTNDR